MVEGFHTTSSFSAFAMYAFVLLVKVLFQNAVSVRPKFMKLTVPSLASFPSAATENFEISAASPPDTNTAPS
jgi:hypothetical protein